MSGQTPGSCRTRAVTRPVPSLRVSRDAALDLNSEPSQSEQIVWDDPTARQERARLADNLQWPGGPSQCSEPLALPPAPPADTGSHFRDSMTDSELVEMGEEPPGTSVFFPARKSHYES